MRIIGGKYRGKKLISPTSDKVRPTSDMARGAIFNILRSKSELDFGQLKLLDVFCGTGAFSLEAISQGFGKVVAVDIDLSSINKNLKLFNLDKNVLQLIKSDVGALRSANESFDVLFMDAPYKKGLSEIALQKLDEGEWLQAGAWCLIEMQKNEEVKLPQNFEFIDERRYGLAKIIIARYHK